MTLGGFLLSGCPLGVKDSSSSTRQLKAAEPPESVNVPDVTLEAAFLEKTIRISESITDVFKDGDLVSSNETGQIAIEDGLGYSISGCSNVGAFDINRTTGSTTIKVSSPKAASLPCDAKVKYTFSESLVKEVTVKLTFVLDQGQLKDFVLYIKEVNSSPVMAVGSYDSVSGIITVFKEVAWTKGVDFILYPSSADPTHIISYLSWGSPDVYVTKIVKDSSGRPTPSEIAADTSVYQTTGGASFTSALSVPSKSTVALTSILWATENRYYLIRFNANGTSTFEPASTVISGLAIQTFFSLWKENFLIYTDHLTHNAWTYELNSDLTLTSATPLSTGVCANSVCNGGYPTAGFSHNSKPVYYQTSFYTDKIGNFDINETTGAVSFSDVIDVVDAPYNMFFSPNGKFVAVPSNTSGVGFAIYSIDTTSGKVLSPAVSSLAITTSSFANYLSYDPESKFIFTVAATKTLSRTSMNPETAALSSTTALSDLGAFLSKPVFLKTTLWTY
jgi:hypothetical protein